MSDDPREAAKEVFAVAPSASSAVTSGGGGEVSVSAADAAVAVASSVVRRRMYERKEDVCSASRGAVVVGTGPVQTCIPRSAM